MENLKKIWKCAQTLEKKRIGVTLCVTWKPKQVFFCSRNAVLPLSKTAEDHYRPKTYFWHSHRGTKKQGGFDWPTDTDKEQMTPKQWSMC